MKKDRIYRYGKITYYTFQEEHYFAITYKSLLNSHKEYMTFKTREKMNEAVDELRKNGYTLISY